MNLVNLRCELRSNPLGIDTLVPRLSWELVSDRRGARQTAYHVVVEDGAGVLWDSGKVASDQSVHVAYQGRPLSSRQRVTWRVRVWDENDAMSDFSSPAWWEMGLLAAGDWQAEWIGSSLVGGARVSSPAPFFRKEFAVSKPVAQARLYASALGLYEFELNGARVGDEIFAPGWTDYHKRVQYQVFDVTEMLRGGANALGAILGDGWYCGYIAAMDRQHYGERPQLLGQLEITYSDGSIEVIATGGDWKWSSGPILESDLIAGESYDARLELPGWNAPGFDEGAWQPALVFAWPQARLVSRANPPVRRQEELVPVQPPTPIGSWSMKNWIFDLGQNMVGFARLKVKGRRGMTVRLRFAEVLKPDGSLYLESLRSARATDYYTLKGDGEEIYEPRFTFHGFRYVEVTGINETPDADMITGVVLHSDIAPAGDFECSDLLVNQLQHNIQWGQKGNFLEVPTDCPQRDERMGWTGDAHVFARTAAFNRDVAAFFTKWMNDFDDAQSSLGQIPPVVPLADPFDLTRDGGPAWADAVMIIPWTMYQMYGDEHILAAHYDTMKRFVEYLRATSTGLIRVHPKTEWKDGNWPGFGDWLAQDGSGKTDGGTQKDLIGTAFFAYSAGLLAKTAEILGNNADAAVYHSLADGVRQAFINRYITRDGLVSGLTQTGYVLALHFDLMPRQLRGAAAEELARDIEARGWHLSTGFVGASYLPFALTHAGNLDIAYRLLFQKSWPSWLYPVTQGATTIWERWDGWTDDKGFQTPEMNSFNHYAYGAIGAWLYAVVAGLDFDQPGYKHLCFKPQPGGGLTSARATTHTIYGLAESAWQQENGWFRWKVVVPPNTTATAWLPGATGKEILEGGRPVDNVAGVRLTGADESAVGVELSAGTYEFEYLY
jgi:alpha-L-rhamnosidase